MAYAIYQSAVDKYEKDKVFTQSKEGTVLLEKQQLEKDREIVLNKKAFVQEQLEKKNQLLGKLVEEKDSHMNSYSELEQASTELVSVIETMQREAERTKSYTVVRQEIDGKLGWPSNDSDRMTSDYGERIHPISGKKHVHTGLDVGAASGTAVLAAENGVVIHSGWIKGYGYTIILDHGDNMSTLYAHNSKLSVKAGDEVKRGQKVSEVGSTGNSTGPHIHFEVRIAGKAVPPLPYLQ
jgi:murein DD-endopeptidase MepM/ murein hydrolase activator NlpD